jgi:cysteine desulfurase
MALRLGRNCAWRICISVIYLDHHATTPLDPVALDSMLPLMRDAFANAGSVTHQAGRDVAEIVNQAIANMANCLGATSDELVMTSGATESNNLALFGVCLHPRQKRRKIVSVVSEHKAILDPLARLAQQGFEVVSVPVLSNTSFAPGQVDLERLAEAIGPDTALVTIMLANNEIGVVQPIREIAKLCRQADCLLHTDATQALGRIAVDVDALDVDLLSFSAHKFYGPKGVGGLFVRRRGRRVKLQGQIVGGGQQHNFRSGTLNTAGIVGMSAALTCCLAALEQDQVRMAGLRDRLFANLQESLDWVQLNGPKLDGTGGVQRLAGNLNCSFFPVEGQSLMLEIPQLAASSGSACTSADPQPSHVLRAIGLTEEQARSSLRFGVGRYNTAEEIDQAALWLIAAAKKLRTLV